MKALAISFATLLLLAPAAIAQTPQPPSQRPPRDESLQSMAPESSQSLRNSVSSMEQLRDSLRQSGFSKVQVVPQSYLIRARDPDGNPIMMIIGPDQIAGVAEIRESGNNMPSGRSVGTNPTAKFVQGNLHNAASSSLEGTVVQSSDNQTIGDIKGVAISDDGSLSYLLSTKHGREIAIDPSAMSMKYNPANDKWTARVDATKSQIASAPQVKVGQ